MMRRIRWASVLLALLLSLPVNAKPWHYNLLEDLGLVGDVGQVQNDSKMQISLTLNYPYWLVRHKARRVLEGRLGLEKETGNNEQALLESRWLTKSVDGAASMFTGYEQVRTKCIFRVGKLGQNETALTASARFQVQKRNKNRGWVDESTRQLRDQVRHLATVLVIACRYPKASQNYQVDVQQTYMAKKSRHGKKGYELPPREDLTEEYMDPSEFSWCEHERCYLEKAPGELHCAKHKPRIKAAPPAPAASSTADELRKLKALLDEGVLTQDEFDAEKRKLLNRSPTPKGQNEVPKMEIPGGVQKVETKN